jgi:4-diphosphocytidyl-2-C-methyl-D-erythritol kinase
MILFPPAKINLGLNILFKRSDGYHEIETVMVNIPWNDILEITTSTEDEFVQTGLEIPGNNSDNLCLKALHLMKNKYNFPRCRIHLWKNIPMGAGLGGGSADAAYVLRGINQFFSLNCSNVELEEMAAQLGSDCPFFIQDIPRIAKGRGELLTPCQLNLSNVWIKLINPGIHISTKEAYEGITFNKNHGLHSIEDVLSGDKMQWKNNLINDFEFALFEKYPMLSDLKDKFYDEGAFYAAMSGSGSTIFGLFDEEPNLNDLPKEYIGHIGKFN